MQTMHVIHITKHSLRHMPTHTHAVGTLEQVTKELLGASSKEEFEYAHALIAYASKVNKDRDYQLVHSYDVY